jgi:branched-subunit amino acid ABC-type transport system permease component
VARSTGPLLAAGAISIGNNVVVNHQPFTLWQPLAVGITAVVFGGIEHIPGAEPFVVGAAWIVLVAVLFVPMGKAAPGKRPATPVESFNNWLNKK